MFPALYYRYNKLVRLFCGYFDEMLFQVGPNPTGWPPNRVKNLYKTFSSARLLVGWPQPLNKEIVNGVHITKISGL